ncbi:hypothetical protein ES705_39898 [subsurface metagenome]
MMTSTPLTIKPISELSCAALKAGRDKKELALWYELRAINSSGSSNPSQQLSSSRLVLNDAVAALVNHFGYTQSTAYRLLRAGDGRLWDIKDPPLGTHEALRKRRYRPSFWTGCLSGGQANNKIAQRYQALKSKSRDFLRWLNTLIPRTSVVLLKFLLRFGRGQGVSRLPGFMRLSSSLMAPRQSR